MNLDKWLEDHRAITGSIVGTSQIAVRSLEAVRWLKAQAEQAIMARDTILLIEWVDTSGGEYGEDCPACKAPRAKGVGTTGKGTSRRASATPNLSDGNHKHPCRVDLMLTLMGLPDQASRDFERARIASEP